MEIRTKTEIKDDSWNRKFNILIALKAVLHKTIRPLLSHVVTVLNKC